MNTHTLLGRAAELICHARYLVALTGAGISTPSGIPDFRSLNSGLWVKVNPLLVASIYAFHIRPQLFFDWVRPLVRTFLDAVPNPAHIALAQLEHMGRLKTIITQNIDALHQKAGSVDVIEVHGHMRSATCMGCHAEVPTDTVLPRFVEGRDMPRCDKCGSILKPNVVLFGEHLPLEAIDAAHRAAQACDTMLVAGSSLTMAPISNLPRIAQENGAYVIVINQQPTSFDRLASIVIREDVAVALPGIVSQLRCVQ
jgi:NAD-dependent deacetylase